MLKKKRIFAKRFQHEDCKENIFLLVYFFTNCYKKLGAHGRTINNVLFVFFFLCPFSFRSHQYNLGGNPNKPCNVLSFKGVYLMLDCGLDINSALHFLPLPLVTSKRLSQLSSWIPRDSPDAGQLDGV